MIATDPEMDLGVRTPFPANESGNQKLTIVGIQTVECSYRHPIVELRAAARPEEWWGEL
jgi:hypothetical protein